MFVPKVWEDQIPLINDLKREEGNIKLPDELYPNTGFIYKIKKSSDDTDISSTPGVVTTDDMINYFTRRDTESIAILTIEFVEQIKYKKLQQSNSDNEVTPGGVSNLQKNTSFNFSTNWDYPDSKEFFLFSKQSLNQGENGFIENQDCFLIKYGNSEDSYSGDIVGWSIFCEAWNSWAQQTGDTYIVFYLTYTSYRPREVVYIEDTYEVMPFLSTQTYLFSDLNNDILSIISFSSSSEIFIYKIQTQAVGTSDYILENNWISEYKYHDDLYKKLLTQVSPNHTLIAPHLANLLDKTDINGTLHGTVNGVPVSNNFSGSRNLYPRYDLIKNCHYISVRANTDIGGNGRTGPVTNLFKVWYGGDNIGIIGDNSRGFHEMTFSEAGIEKPFQLSNAFYINDIVSYYYNYTLGRNEVATLISQTIKNPKFNDADKYEIILKLLQTNAVINDVLIDQQLPLEMETSTSINDIREWKRNNIEDRKYFVLIGLSPEELINIAETPPVTYETLKIYSAAGDEVANLIVPEQRNYINQTKVKPQWLRSKTTALQKEIPIDWKLTTQILETNNLYSLETFYMEGGKTRIIKFLRKDKTPCFGIDEKGNEVPIPPLKIPSLGGSLSGKKGIFKQQIFLGI